MLQLRVALARAGATLALFGAAALSASMPSGAMVSFSGASRIAGGDSHTCAVTTAGGVKCWGRNVEGQIGDGTTTDRAAPVNVVGLASGVAAVATGGSHTCALTSTGAVKCWGSNASGQLGDGSTTDRTTPVDVTGLGSGVLAIAAGYGHSCAITSTGGAKCWGANSNGQLGDGTQTNSTAPVNVVGLPSGVSAIDAGASHTCALVGNPTGGVKCWGRNAEGESGDGTGIGSLRLTPVDVAGLTSGVANIATGSFHTCAATVSGAAKCWGWNIYGQLGDGTQSITFAPVQVAGLASGVAAVTGGALHSCALTTTGGVKCWGRNDQGQVGDTSNTDRPSQVDVLGLSTGVTAVAAGGGHTCALVAGGGAKCWGDNDFGQRGDGTFAYRYSPVDVAGLASGVTAVATGYQHNCVLTTGGGVKCWGRNDPGAIGDGTTTHRLEPANVAGLSSGVTAVDTGQSHSCAVTSTGGVKCWGRGLEGQLGDGTNTVVSTALVDVSGLSSGVAAVAAGYGHTCALTTGGGVKCWGRGTEGQLGDNLTTNSTTPVDVFNLASGVAAITAGAYHTCARTDGGAVKCWGAGLSIGDGTSLPRPAPTDVVGLASGVTAIHAGESHTCALQAGAVKCWGWNLYGQVGDGTTTNRLAPVSVVGLASGMIAVGAGAGHSCAVTTSGAAKCWGWNAFGQLGDGTTVLRPAPVDVAGMAGGVASIGGGLQHTCALTGAGGVKCWGGNSIFQLGMGFTAGSADPADVLTFDGGPAAAVSSSLSHTLALDADGKVYAWGSDSHGQLGQGRAINRPTPAQVAGIPAMTHLSLSRHALAIDGTSQAWAWGDNSCGQLGPRDTTVTTKPAPVTGATSATRVASGGCFSLARKADGTVLGWGLVPGYGTQTNVRQLAGLNGIDDIVAGADHALALAGGTVWAFGENASGQLGVGTVGSAQGAAQVPGLTTVVQVAAGRNASAARLASGQIRFWGRHSDQSVVASPTTLPATPGALPVSISLADAELQAALANGSVVKFAPATAAWEAVGGYSGIAQVEGGAGFDLGIGAGGQVYARGGNTAGQLGQGNTNPQASVVAVPGMTSVTILAAGTVNPSVLALKSDGSVWFWGADTLGESGDGGVIGSSVPRLVSVPATIRQVAAGDRFSVALDTNGDAWGWGDNGAAALDGTYVNRSTPARIPGAANVQSIAAGGSGFVLFHMTDGTVRRSGTLAPGLVTDAVKVVPFTDGTIAIAAGSSAYGLKSGNVLYAFGSNASGELGNGTTVASELPVQVQGIAGAVTGFSAGLNRAAAITSDGKVWSWGAAPLGNGSSGSSSVAVAATGVTDAAQVTVGRLATMVRRTGGGLLAWGDTALADAVAQNTLLPYAVAPPAPIKSVHLGAANAVGYVIGNTGLAWGFGKYLAYSNLSSAIGDGTYVPRTRPVVLRAPGGAGALNTNNWFFDLEPASAESVPAASVPKLLGEAQLSGYGAQDGISLAASVKGLTTDNGKTMGIYIFGYVPPAFLGLVKTAPSMSKARIDTLQKAGEPVFVQLTPSGWETVTGQLVAYSSGVMSGATDASSILDRVSPTPIPGARFCIGYGESATDMLSRQTLGVVLELEGASQSASGLPCLLSGVYVTGPPTSLQGTDVGFTATVVGLSPTGTVQFKDFKDGVSTLLNAPATLAAGNAAVSSASIVATSLSPGQHSIDAAYSGDGNNDARSADVALLHTVLSAASVTLAGPVASAQGQAVTFTATVTGANPTGTVQFKDGAGNLGAPATIFGGVASITTAALPVGARTISAVHGASGVTSNTLTHTVSALLATSVSLTSSSNPSGYGAPVTLTATVTGAGPTGSVAFFDGGTLLATQPLAAGAASHNTSALQPGVHQLRANYSGDSNNAGASSAVLFQAVSDATLFTLSVAKGGLGSGTVTSSPAGINCAPPCSASFASGVTVTLAASPASGSIFSGWSGACSGTANCVVTMDAAKSVTATFTATYLLQVGKAGTGGGTVSSTAPAGAIDCGATCSASFNSGTAVTLAATPAAGSTFTGWSGACSGTGSCALTMDAAKNVTATFVTSAALGINPTSLDFGGQSMQTTSAAKTVTVSNSGSLPLSVTAVELSSTQFAQTNNCTSVAAGGSCTVNVTFTPAASTTASVPVNASLTVKTGAGDGTVSLFGTGERTLVTHYYASILRRAPDSGGKAFWTAEAARVQALGVNVNEVWFAMAQAFYFSAEYLALNRDNTGFVTDLYNTFFNRAPDQGGLDYWVGQLAGGMPREVALASFMFSAEFRSFTSAIFGNTTARAEVDAVVDFYRGLLARLPDDGGFAYWVGQFRAAQCSGQAAILAQVEAISSAYTLSAEYAARNRGNVQYVGDLYNAFLRRGGDLAGVLFWINQVATGAQTREQVRVQFRNSAEFQQRVNAIVQQGCFT